MTVASPILRALAAFTLCLGVGACAKTPTDPDDPGPPKTGVAGTWLGDASDSSGPGRMTWEIQQDASPFAGVLLVIETYGGYGGKGSVSGTVSGTSLHFTLKVPVAGFEPPFASCTSEMTGDAELRGSSIAGTYTGTSSCGGAVTEAITDGQFTLTRQ